MAGEASPLAEIERSVQERAKDLAVDAAGPDGNPRLRALVEAEVTRWNDDHARGRGDYPLADPALVTERALRNLRLRN